MDPFDRRETDDGGGNGRSIVGSNGGSGKSHSGTSWAPQSMASSSLPSSTQVAYQPHSHGFIPRMTGNSEVSSTQAAYQPHSQGFIPRMTGNLEDTPRREEEAFAFVSGMKRNLPSVEQNTASKHYSNKPEADRVISIPAEDRRGNSPKRVRRVPPGGSANSVGQPQRATVAPKHNLFVQTQSPDVISKAIWSASEAAIGSSPAKPNVGGSAGFVDGKADVKENDTEKAVAKKTGVLTREAEASNATDIKFKDPKDARENTKGNISSHTGAAADPQPALQPIGSVDPPGGEKTVPASKPQSKKKDTNDKSPGKEQKKKGSKRKKPAAFKPAKRVLVQKKEREMALALLQDKRDLLNYISKEDSFFLAKEFWIFTVQQLRFVLEPDTAKSDDTEAVARSLREEILAKLPVKCLMDRKDSKHTNEEDARKRHEKERDDVSEESVDKEGKKAELSKATVSANVAMEVTQSGSATSGEPDSSEVVSKPPEESPTNVKTNEPQISASAAILEAAENRMKEWMSKIDNALNNAERVETPVESRFPLDGPISCLLPAATRNFLASIPIKTLFGFLSLKRTETGAICDFFRIWRRICGLSEMNPLALAKHLLSVSARIETAISSVPPVDRRTREWMIDPIIVMTGAAKDFLIDDQRIISCSGFIEMRTKQLATELVRWREEKGLPPLKGSGKVAMISGWKAIAKESMEVEMEDGQVLTGIDLEAEATAEAAREADQPTDETKSPTKKKTRPAKVDSSGTNVESEFSKPIPPLGSSEAVAGKLASVVSKSSTVIPVSEVVPEKMETSKRQTPRRRRTMRDRQIEYVRHSSLFLEDVLGEEVKAFLASLGIRTTFDLANADLGPLTRALLESGQAKDASECEDTVEEWRDLLEVQLDEMRRHPFYPDSEDPSSLKEAKSRELAPRNSSLKEPLNKEQPHFEVSHGEPVAKKAKTWPRVSVGETSHQDEAVRNPTHRDEAVRNPSKSRGDAFEALSSVTQRFLRSMGISTAEGFLTSRTTDIAAEFVKWRAKEHMSELKGLGAIASVSGWKAMCRKAAKEMGMTRVAEMQPENKPTFRGPSKVTEIATSQNLLVRPPPASRPRIADNFTHEDVLEGKPRRVFAVQRSEDPKKQYRFELTVRKRESDDSVGLFISYKGAGLPWKDEFTAHQLTSVPTANETSSQGCRLPEMAVLVDAPLNRSDSYFGLDLRSTFLTNREDAGLAELSIYGVRPLRNQHLSLMKEALTRFVLSGAEELSTLDPETGNCNVLIHRRDMDACQYLLYLNKPFEKGQTVELRFPSVSMLLRSRAYEGSRYRDRHIIVDALNSLSRSDLRVLRSFLVEELLAASGYQKELDNLISFASDADIERFMAACTARRRLHWVSLRIGAAMGELDRKKSSEKCFFDWRSQVSVDSPKPLPETYVDGLKSALGEELREEFLASIEFDPLCGASRRSRWSKLADHLFWGLLTNLLELYSSPDDSSTSVVEKIEGCVKRWLPESVDPDKLDDFILSSHQLDSLLSNDEMKLPCLINDSSKQGSPDLSQPEPRAVVVCELPSDLNDQPKEGLSVEPKSLLSIRSLSDARDGKAIISLDWYRRFQWQLTSTVLSSFGSLLCEEDTPRFKSEEILSSLSEVNGTASVQARKPHFCSPLWLPPAQGTGAYEPHTYQFFLGIVWPALRKLGWRLDAGETPSDLTYVSPVRPQTQAESGKNSRIVKQQRARKRARLASEVNKLSSGDIRKFTKRLFVAVVGYNEEQEEYNMSDSGAGGVSVDECLNLFHARLQVGMAKDDKQGFHRASSIVNSLRECFDGIAPSLSIENTDDDSLGVGSGTFSKDSSTEVLVRLLMVFPCIARHSGLSSQELKSALEVIRELSDFIELDREQILGDQVIPPLESYVGQDKTGPSSSLAARLSCTKSVSETIQEGSSKTQPPESGDKFPDETTAVELTDLILEGDQNYITDFVECVLSNTSPCRATPEDAARKNRRIPVGHPGLVCGHCMGAAEGRYFFATVDSLTTANTVMEKHLAKCPSVPASVKAQLVESKRRHSEQKKNLAHGGQHAFYVRLWERLHSSKIDGTFVRLKSSALAVSGAGQQRMSSISNKKPPLPTYVVEEFTSYIRLLDFVRTKSPWKDMAEVAEALNQYYNCVDYGGRIYHTTSMPKNFSSEWLLAKVVPRKQRFTTPRMPG